MPPDRVNAEEIENDINKYRLHITDKFLIIIGCICFLQVA